VGCAGCGRENRDGARFCKFCGATLVARCPSCGADLTEDSLFCDACGAAVGGPADAQPVSAARKVVTVLFADLTGSTALEERMDAESVRELLDRFNTALRKDVEDLGGRVVKFTGDGLMAAFGIASVREDDADRAIECALAMCTTCEQLSIEAGRELALKVGVNTGEVVVIADDDDVVGDTVNVAARLEGVATAGEVLVGEETWRLTRATTRYEPIEPLVLKGKADPVPAYRLLAVGEAAEVATPFIGREAEVAELLAVFDECVRTNSARLVTIVGSPGLGKTRLAHELMSRLEDRARVRETRCDPAGSATFAPIADALRGAAGIAESATESEVMASLLSLLPKADPDRERIASRAASILGAGEPGSTEETFWAVRRLIEHAATSGPVVLVLDDLHWGEPVLLDLVEHLAEWIRDRPVMLVATGRPELRDIRPTLVEGGIALEGLDHDDTARLALGLLGTTDAPDDLLAKIPASTQGNPLFVRELVRMLVDDGILRREGDAWSVTVDVDAIEVPPTIQSLLAARVDRLSNDERLVVELASVLGKEFYKGVLIELAPLGVRERIDPCLESLRRKEFVEPLGTYWVDEAVYGFHHALIRDAAYRRLLKETRADLHERVAAWYERKTAGVLGEHDELIGYHLEQAHDYKRQLGRPDEALGSRAASLLGSAAARALDRDDLPAAAALSGRALACLPAEGDERLVLLQIRCESLLAMGDVANASSAVAEFDRLAESPRWRAWSTCFSGQLANLTSPERLESTEEAVASAAAALTAMGDQAGAAKAHTVLASALAGLGRFAACESVLDKALTAARAAGDNRRITACLGSGPVIALWGPSPVSRAGGRCLDLIRLLRITTGSPAVEATSKRCQAVLEAFRGRAEAARNMLRQARKMLTELGLQHDLLETELFAGIVELITGDAFAAEEHLAVAHDGFRRFGVDVLAAQSAALLARAYLMLGDDERVASLVGASEHVGSQDLKTAIAWRSVQAELLARRGEFDDARRLAQSAVDIAAKTDALVDHADACRALAAVCHLGGDLSAARAAEEEARALYERKGATALVGDVNRPGPAASGLATDAVGPNRAVRAAFELARCFEARDVEGALRLVGETSVVEDRRIAFSTSAVGRGPIGDMVRDLMDIGTTTIDYSLVATRGEDLALLRVVFRGPEVGTAAFEGETLTLYELAEDGTFARVVFFEMRDLDAAVAELDERYLAGAGAEFADVWRHTMRTLDAINARDWRAFAAVGAPDIVFEGDSSAGMSGALDASSVLAYASSIPELVPDSHLIARAIHAIDAKGVLFHHSETGVASGGGTVEVTSLIALVVEGGKVVRVVTSSVDDLDAALTRFRELTSQSPDTLAVRVAEQYHRYLLDTHAESGFRVSRDFTFEDRRPGLRVELGPSTEHAEQLKDVVEIAQEPLATRGERLYLYRATLVMRNGFDICLLNVFEVDENGKPTANILFAEDDLDAAMAELEARHARQTEPDTFAVRVVRRFSDVVASGDLDAFDAMIADGSTFEDRRAGLRTLIQGRAERRAHVEAIRRIGVTRVVPEILEVRGEHIALARVHVGGANSEFAAELLALVEIDERGLIMREFMFDPDDLDAARAELDALDAERTSRSGIPPLENLVTRAAERLSLAITSNDVHGTELVFAEDVSWEDRRPALGTVLHGRTDIVDLARAMFSVGVRRMRYDVLATRGERLGVGRVTIDGGAREDTFAVDFLAVVRLNDQDLISNLILFPDADFVPAMAELDALYLRGEGEPHANAIRAASRLRDFVNDRDWASLRDVFTEDVEVVDHRPVSLGHMHGPDEWITTIQALADLVPFRQDIATYRGFRENAVLYEAFTHGFDDQGGAFENRFLCIGVLRGERFARWELLGLEQYDHAVERLDELAVKSSEHLDNAAARAFVAIFQHVVDVDRLRTIVAPDVVGDDRRIGLTSSGKGFDSFMKNLDALTETELILSTFEVIAAPHERYALAHATFGSSEGFDADVLAVIELNEDLLLQRYVIFDTDALDEARDELERSYRLP
jgi:class 3 adenylate cyclase/tetratricopeptide (TPR) repeat protein